MGEEGPSSAEALAQLQQNFDDYIESSRELENELESELEKLQEKVSQYANKNAELESRCADLQSKARVVGGEASGFQSELARLKTTLQASEAAKRKLESGQDDLENKLRRAESEVEDLQHKLDCAIEDKVFIQNDLEDLQEKGQREQRRLREEITELQQEVEQLQMRGNGVAAGSEERGLRGFSMEAEEVIAGLEEEVELMNEQLAEARDLSSKANGAAEAADLTEEERAALLSDMDELTKLNEELAQTCGELSDELQQKSQAAHEATERVDGLEEQLQQVTASLNDEVIASKGEAAQLRAKLEERQAELKERDDLVAELKRKGAAKDAHVEKVEARAGEQLERAQGELAAARDELAAALAQLSLLSSHLEEPVHQEQPHGESAREADTDTSGPDDVEALRGQVFQLERALDKERARANEAVAASPMPFRGRSLPPLPGSPRVERGEHAAPITPPRGLPSAVRSPFDALSPEPATAAADAAPAIADGAHEAEAPAPAVELVLSRGVAAAALESTLAEGTPEDLREALRALSECHNSERAANLKLLNKLQAVKGNIEVVCRVRPPTAAELEANAATAVEVLGEGELGLLDRRTNQWRSFTLDRVLGPEMGQQDIFAEVEPLALSAAEGFNACIFAYGQTGSGKTYTMQGKAEGGEYGVSVRTLHKMFEVLSLKKERAGKEGFQYSVRVAMLEIYNDEVRDLLVPRGEPSAKLEIKRSAAGIMGVQGLKTVSVTGVGDVLRVSSTGNSARAVQATNVHAHSSRSHSVLEVEVTTQTGSDGLPSTGRLYLVDLAGSERVKTSGVSGEALKEATHINSSLSALGDVMQALDQKAKHVPYRNSKLTYLLQDALGGNSRTAMVVTICPTITTSEETLHALGFATRVRNISLGPAQRNVNAKNLQQEVKELRGRVKESVRLKQAAEESLVSLQREHKRSTQKMNTVVEARAKSVGAVREELESQMGALRKQLEEQKDKFVREKGQNSKLAGELEEEQRQRKRLQAKVATQARDMEDQAAKKAGLMHEIAVLKSSLRDTKDELRRAARARRNSTVSVAAAATATAVASKAKESPVRGSALEEGKPTARSPLVTSGSTTPIAGAVSPAVSTSSARTHPATIGRSESLPIHGSPPRAPSESASASRAAVRSKKALLKHQERMARIQEIREKRKEKL
ncbi:unnamed protein product [Chrysoparadoxa australica]